MDGKSTGNWIIVLKQIFKKIKNIFKKKANLIICLYNNT